MTDIAVTDNEVKVIIDVFGVEKENININTYEGKLEVTNNDKRKYQQVIDLPQEADIETIRSKYNNGIIEITSNKKSRKNIKERIVKWINNFR